MRQKTRLLTLLALLMTAATGATHRGRQGPPGHRPRPAHAQPDRNAVTLSIAVGSQNLRTASAKEKRTPAGCPTTQMGDPSRVDIPSTILPGVLRTPRLLRGDGFTVQPNTANGPLRRAHGRTNRRQGLKNKSFF